MCYSVKSDTYHGFVPYADSCANVQGPAQITKYLDCRPDDWQHRVCSNTDTHADSRQMAATLMFQVKGVVQVQGVDTGDECPWHFANPNHLYFNTEAWQVAGSPLEPGRFAFKKPNVALNEGTLNSPAATWWVNGLLIYGVDGLCQPKRFNTGSTSSEPCPSAGTVVDGLKIWSAEEAYAQAVALLIDAAKSAPSERGKQLKAAITDILGPKVSIVAPDFSTVGETLYLRETIHMKSSTPRTARFGESTYYQLSGREVFDADSPSAIALGHTVAMGFYQMDSNGYRKMQIKPGVWTTSNYGSGGLLPPGTTNPDLFVFGLGSDDNPSAFSDMQIFRDAGGDHWTKAEPINPAAIPYEVMITDAVTNLLVCSYAQNMDPWAWTMLRLLPTLAVMGDAAGVSAAVGIANNNAQPAAFNDALIQKVQENILTRTTCSGATVTDGVDGWLPHAPPGVSDIKWVYIGQEYCAANGFTSWSTCLQGACEKQLGTGWHPLDAGAGSLFSSYVCAMYLSPTPGAAPAWVAGTAGDYIAFEPYPYCHVFTDENGDGAVDTWHARYDVGDAAFACTRCSGVAGCNAGWIDPASVVGDICNLEVGLATAELGKNTLDTPICRAKNVGSTFFTAGSYKGGKCVVGMGMPDFYTTDLQLFCP